MSDARLETLYAASELESQARRPRKGLLTAIKLLSKATCYLSEPSRKAYELLSAMPPFYVRHAILAEKSFAKPRQPLVDQLLDFVATL